MNNSYHHDQGNHKEDGTHQKTKTAKQMQMELDEGTKRNMIAIHGCLESRSCQGKRDAGINQVQCEQTRGSEPTGAPLLNRCQELARHNKCDHLPRFFADAACVETSLVGQGCEPNRGGQLYVAEDGNGEESSEFRAGKSDSRLNLVSETA